MRSPMRTRVESAESTSMMASPVSIPGISLLAFATACPAAIFLGSWVGKMDSMNCSICLFTPCQAAGLRKLEEGETHTLPHWALMAK